MESINVGSGIDWEVFGDAIDALGDNLPVGLGRTFIYVPKSIGCSGRPLVIDMGTSTEDTAEDEDEMSSRYMKLNLEENEDRAGVSKLVNEDPLFVNDYLGLSEIETETEFNEVKYPMM